MTRLTALELFGFKSFADRTRFEFPAGITVVVGPNGSGKSNVVDAIKWVLGEQSVRSLRGKEMTDVIFAGSAVRKPLNMAEVSLIFDNTARLLPVPGDEVQISRRVYRNGESEYLVNGEPARLRDIRELFSGTGAATEAYSVIEQGRVDALLVASGRDRRVVFEEAAGITKFRTRRGEALRRLERAEQNRQRLADIVGEVAARLETVRHQAARARRWRTMQDRLRRFRIAAATRDLSGVDAAITAVERTLAEARAAWQENEAHAAAAAADATALTAATETLQPRLTAARSAAAGDIQRAAAAEATAASQRVRTTRLRERAEPCGAGGRRGGPRRAHRRRRRRGRLDHRAGRRRHARRPRRPTRRAGDGGGGIARRRRRDAARSHDRHGRARRPAEAAPQTGYRSRARGGSPGRRPASAGAAREAVTAARRRRAALDESRAACEGHAASLEQRLAAAVGDAETLEAAQREAAAALQAAWRDLAGWKAACEACRERRGMLQEMVARQEGVSDAARKLLAEGAAAAVPGFTGVLADRVVTGVDWAPLVDLALGELGQSLVVDSLADAVQWHAGWSGTAGADDVLAAGGRIGFLATGHLREPEAFDPGPHPGIIGRLDRLIVAGAEPPRTDDETAFFRRLLGRVWVVERIEHALPLLPAAPAGTLFLTRSGVSLTAEGGFAIGTPAASAGLVARRSELRALDERHADLARTVDRARPRSTASRPVSRHPRKRCRRPRPAGSRPPSGSPPRRPNSPA